MRDINIRIPIILFCSLFARGVEESTLLQQDGLFLAFPPTLRPPQRRCVKATMFHRFIRLYAQRKLVSMSKSLSPLTRTSPAMPASRSTTLLTSKLHSWRRSWSLTRSFAAWQAMNLQCTATCRACASIGARAQLLRSRESRDSSSMVASSPRMSSSPQVRLHLILLFFCLQRVFVVTSSINILESAGPALRTMPLEQLAVVKAALRFDGSDHMILGKLLDDPIAPKFFAAFRNLLKDAPDLFDETMRSYIQIRRFGLLGRTVPKDVCLYDPDGVVFEWNWAALIINFDERAKGHIDYSVDLMKTVRLGANMSDSRNFSSFPDALQWLQKGLVALSERHLKQPPRNDTRVLVDWDWLQTQMKGMVLAPLPRWAATRLYHCFASSRSIKDLCSVYCGKLFCGTTSFGCRHQLRSTFQSRSRWNSRQGLILPASISNAMLTREKLRRPC